MKLSNSSFLGHAVVLIVTVMMGFPMAVVPLFASDIYVSVHAGPGGNGSKESPFQSIEEARQAVRKLDGNSATVHIGAGHYILRNGFVFAAGDSASPGQRITYSGEPGGGTRVSSGVIVPPESLRPVTDPAILARFPEETRTLIREVSLDALGIQVTPFKDNFRGLELLEVFWNGDRLPLSRWPGGGRYARINKVTDNGIQSPSAGTFLYEGDRPSRWSQALEEGLWIRGFWRVPWTIESVRVGAIDPINQSITLAVPVSNGIGSKYHRAPNNGVGPGSGEEPWEAFNLIEEIDATGEWAVRFSTRMLYILPPEGSGQLLISDHKNPVISLTEVSNFALEHLVVDSGLGEGIRVEGGENVLIAGCIVSNVARNGIVLRGGTGHTVLSCDTAETGLSGLVYSGGDRATLTPAGHRILNNLVRRAGLFFPAPGIDAGLTIRDQPVGNLVANNRIHDCMNSGIVYAGNENIFEFNEIYRVGLGSSDLGGFYTTGGWTSRGNIVRFNFVHHSMNANAFYVDDGDSGDTFVSNVAYRTESGGFIGGGHDQVFRNNIIIESPRAMHVDSRGVPRNYTADDPRLRGDLESVPYMTPPWSEKYPTLTTLTESIPEMPSGIVIEENLFVRCEMALRKSGKKSELERIVFENNVESDDLEQFVDPENLDFSLKPGAPVFSSIPSFPNIDFSKIGIQPDKYRPVVPPRDMELLRTGRTDRGFDSQTDIDASNR